MKICSENEVISGRHPHFTSQFYRMVGTHEGTGGHGYYIYRMGQGQILYLPIDIPKYISITCCMDNKNHDSPMQFIINNKC